MGKFVNGTAILTDDLFRYDTHYLSDSGTDMSTCGRTANAACKFIEYILSLYYKASSKPDVGLEIISSKSLIIYQQLMVSYLKNYESFISEPLEIKLLSLKKFKASSF